MACMYQQNIALRPKFACSCSMSLRSLSPSVWKHGRPLARSADKQRHKPSLTPAANFAVAKHLQPSIPSCQSSSTRAPSSSQWRHLCRILWQLHSAEPYSLLAAMQRQQTKPCQLKGSQSSPVMQQGPSFHASTAQQMPMICSEHRAGVKTGKQSFISMRMKGSQSSPVTQQALRHRHQYPIDH